MFKKRFTNRNYKIILFVGLFLLLPKNAFGATCSTYYPQPAISNLDQLPSIPYESAGINYTNRIIFWSYYDRWQVYDMQEVYPFVQINGNDVITFEMDTYNTIRFDDQNQQYTKKYLNNASGDWVLFTSGGTEAVLDVCYVFNQSIYLSTLDVYFSGSSVPNAPDYYNVTVQDGQLMYESLYEQAIDFFAGFSDDFYTDSWHLIYPKEYLGTPYEPSFNVIPDDSFTFVFYLRHYAIPIADGLPLVFSKFDNENYENVIQSYGSEAFDITFESETQATVKITASVLEGVKEFYRVGILKNGSETEFASYLPFSAIGDSSSDISSATTTHSGTFCNNYGTISNVLCDFFLPDANYFPKKFDAVKNQINTSMPFIDQIITAFQSGIQKIDNADNQAPNIASASIYGAEVEFVNFGIISDYMPQFKLWISAMMWFGFLYFLIRKSTTILHNNE